MQFFACVSNNRRGAAISVRFPTGAGSLALILFLSLLPAASARDNETMAPPLAIGGLTCFFAVLGWGLRFLE